MGFLSIFKRRGVDPATRAELIDYLKAELELAAAQGKAAEDYNRGVAAFLGMPPTGPAEEDAAIRRVVEATSRYLEVLNSLVARHGQIGLPPEGSECFLAHEMLYRSYVHWGENRLLAYSNLGRLTDAQEAAIAASDKAFMRDKKEADRAKGRLLRVIGISPHEAISMMQEAGRH